MISVIYKSDRITNIVKLIHSSKLITDQSDYWINTYLWSNAHLKKALEFVPSRFKSRGKTSWNPELRAYIYFYKDDFKKHGIESKSGYILYNGKEVRTVESAGYSSDQLSKYQLVGA